MFLIPKIKRSIAVSLIIGCGMFLLLFFQTKPDVVKLLRKIPKEEQFALEIFFRNLISIECGCYVLFGDKPASLLSYTDWEEVDPSDFHREYINFFSPEKKGFEVWQKYQHLFPMKSYAFIKTRGFYPKNHSEIFLVHKSRLLKIIKKNFLEFKRVFSQFNSPEQLFEKLLNDPSFLEQICSNHNHFLLGIILGFGKKNAAYFNRKLEINNFLSPSNYCHLDSSFFNSLKKPISQSNHISLEEEKKILEAKLGFLIKPEEPSLSFTLHYPLGYIVDATVTDVPGLRKKYKQQQYKATKAYQNGSFLEITLREMMR